LARDQRRLAAIVSADVAGYSRLMGRDESGMLAVLKSHCRELIDPKIAEFGGRIVKTTGDGLLLELPSVVDAVRCAVDVQRGMAERNAGMSRDKQIEFRIGINVGDIIIDGDDIYGDGVVLASPRLKRAQAASAKRTAEKVAGLTKGQHGRSIIAWKLSFRDCVSGRHPANRPVAHFGRDSDSCDSCDRRTYRLYFSTAPQPSR